MDSVVDFIIYDSWSRPGNSLDPKEATQRTNVLLPSPYLTFQKTRKKHGENPLVFTMGIV